MMLGVCMSCKDIIKKNVATKSLLDAAYNIYMAFYSMRTKVSAGGMILSGDRNAYITLD